MTRERTSNEGGEQPAGGKAPVVIKKYANRRLYDTGTSVYVTLEDLATMVKRGDDFVVTDAKNGEDITRSVLAQIIFEQEGKGQSLLPITFLRQLIRFYGDSMQMLVPSYLEFSLAKLAQERGGFGQMFAPSLGQPFGGDALSNAARPVFAQLEEQTRQNMAMFRQALSMFAPFPAAPAPDRGAATAADAPPARNTAELDDMRRQLDALQRRIEGLTPKD